MTSFLKLKKFPGRLVEVFIARLFRNCQFRSQVDTWVFHFFTGNGSNTAVQPVRSSLICHRQTCSSFVKTSWPNPRSTHVFSVNAVPDILSLQCRFAGSPHKRTLAYHADTWSSWAAAPSPLGFQTTRTNRTGQLYAEFPVLMPCSRHSELAGAHCGFILHTHHGTTHDKG